MKSISGLTGLLIVFCLPAAAAPELIFIAPINNTMPLARFDGRQLSGGILKDLGDAIAARLNRKARYLDTPGKRVWEVLAKGAADGVCYVVPEWAEGSFNWSPGLIPDGVAIVAHPSAPRLRQLKDLSGKPVGTVFGYHYPNLDVLGKQFMRDDSPSMEHNLNRLSAGGRQYALVELTTLAYRLRSEPSVRLRTELVYHSFHARCAFSKRSAVSFASIQQAIAGLLDDGSIGKILSNYK